MKKEADQETTRPTSRRFGLWKAILDRAGPISVSPDEGLIYWQERIFLILISVALVLSFIAIIPAVIMAVQEKLWRLLVMDTAVFICALGAFFMRSLGYYVRAGILVALIYLIGLGVILNVGIFSGGLFWLFSFAVVTAVLLGLQAAVAALILNGITLAVLGWIFNTGDSGQNFILYVTMGRTITAGANFIFLNTMATLSIAVLVQGLIGATQKEKEAFEKLKRERTQLVEAEASLQDSEKRFREMAELMPETIFEMDMDGRLTFVNRKAYEMFRYPPEDFEKGVSVYDMIVSEDRLRLTEHIAQIVRGEAPGVREYTARRKDESLFPVMIQTAVTFRKGSLKRFRGFIVDLTEKKKLEIQLRQSQKMEAIGTLAGGIAHDFNNMLSAILGYTELSLESIKEGTILHGNLLKLKSAGERARDLVRQILTFSRRSEQELIPIRIKPIVKEALKLLRPSLPTTIEIQTNIQSDATILGDPTQIHQILINLCANASHAMTENGGLLWIALTDREIDQDFTTRHPELSPGRYLHLAVKDTGHGIPPDIADRIFDPFFTTKELGRGTGMGLSVVHGIVSSHGGVITVDSEPGKGTVFDIYFPVSDSESAAESRSEKPLPLGHERILFVDDELHQVDLGKQMLESLGYTVVTKTGSLEALEEFRKNPDRFDLLITDMTMPNMTGDELAVKMMAIRPDLPVILCTGYSEKITEDQAHALGIKAYIFKPVLLRDLANIIRKVLNP